MTNYQELKRLAEAAKLELADIANVVIEDGDLSHHELLREKCVWRDEAQKTHCGSDI